MENEFFLNTGIAQLLHFEPSNGDLNSSSDCFYISPIWEKSTDQNHHHNNNHFDSALSSMVSSPVASNSNLSGESFVIRELIGKLGNSSGEISGYTTPANSPPKHTPASAPAVAEFCAADPGFAARAARFSCFGSRSFNGRPGPGPVPSRVSSSPSLKDLGSGASSEQNQSPIIPNDTDNNNNNNNNTRKRKASASKAKPKELPISKVSEINENSNSNLNLNNAKRNKGNEEEESKGINSGDEKEKNSPKPPEPPKDYIHVRARRGQATDSHSLAERVRREKISERMKLLQDLVPGCNKVTGKALMLDEIINYVQSLQRQVEFLSMKLSSVNTRLDGNTDTLMSKDVFQPNNSMSMQQQLDSSAQSIFGHQTQQNQGLHCNISSGPMNHCPIDTLDTSLCQNLGINGFSDIVSQYQIFGEDELQSIVQMGYGQIPNREASLQPQSIHGPNLGSHMKIEH